MASDLLFSVDARALKRSLQKAARRLKATEKDLKGAMDSAVVKYAEDTLAEATQRTPVKEGALRAAGAVDGPHDISGGIEVFIGFDKVYARIQDLGGTIVPVRAKRLFIPLREGVQPLKKGDPRRKDQKQGIDFVLAKRATLPGSRYLTGLMPERAANATREVGTAAIRILQSRLGKRRS